MLPAQMRGGRIQVKTQTVAQAAKPREMLEAAAPGGKSAPGGLPPGRYGNVILADKELNIKAVIQKGTRIV